VPSSLLAPTDDGEFDSDGLGWLFLRELLQDVLKGDFIVIGPAMWVFLGVLGAFVVTRGITRFIRRRSASGAQASGPIKDITVGGVHLHHQVFGITLMFLTGLLLVATTPGGALLDVLALLFGVGVGLAFDEFALWLHLDDVYWSEQGRKSIDAVAIVLVLTASVRAILDLLQVFETSAEMGDFAWLVWVLVAITVIPAVICLVKGKLVTAALGIVYQPVGIVGAFRLAKPGSPWSRYLYGTNSRRRRRSDRRFNENYSARLDRWRDLVGGTPENRAVGASDNRVGSETENRAVETVITPAQSDPPT